MATANPYDRREPELREATHGRWVDLHAPPDILDDGRRAYPGFSLARLEELLRDEFARGFNSGEGTMERRLEEEILPQSQRLAWEQGREAGAADGHQGLLREIAGQFEKRANDMLERLAEVLDADTNTAEGRKRTTKARLGADIDEARMLLRDMVKAHHAGFPIEAPC